MVDVERNGKAKHVLSSGELTALNALRDLRLVSTGGSIAPRDTFDALVGLYTNAGDEAGMTVNRTDSFRDDAACVQTVISGLAAMKRDTERRGTVDFSHLSSVGTHGGVRAEILKDMGILFKALKRDYHDAYAAAMTHEHDASLLR